MQYNICDEQMENYTMLKTGNQYLSGGRKKICTTKMLTR